MLLISLQKMVQVAPCCSNIQATNSYTDFTFSVIKVPSLTVAPLFFPLSLSSVLCTFVIFVLVLYYCFNSLYLPNSLLPLGTECICSLNMTFSQLKILTVSFFSQLRCHFPWKDLLDSLSTCWCPVYMLQNCHLLKRHSNCLLICPCPWYKEIWNKETCLSYLIFYPNPGTQYKSVCIYSPSEWMTESAKN